MPKPMTKWTHVKGNFHIENGSYWIYWVKLIIVRETRSSQMPDMVIFQGISLLKCFSSSKCSHVWLKSIFGAVGLGSIPSWYQKVGFFIGSHMGSQETPCCNVINISFGKGSPINFGSWIVSMFIFVFSITISKCHYYEM